jgi:hypothetical protein
LKLIPIEVIVKPVKILINLKQIGLNKPKMKKPENTLKILRKKGCCLIQVFQYGEIISRIAFTATGFNLSNTSIGNFAIVKPLLKNP